MRLDGSDGDILIGGAGNALQIGGRGRSLLVAGFGSERLAEEALGDTSLDAALEASAGDEAFQSIMAGWHASDNFADRVADLLGKTAPRPETTIPAHELRTKYQRNQTQRECRTGRSWLSAMRRAIVISRMC